jgi:beta-glucanase (GH16 family)
VRRALVALLLSAGCGGGGDPPPWQLVWSDELEGPAGAAPDPARWSRELGGSGWGNQELQFYTDRPENAALDGAGRLAITARQESWGGRAFTSARLTTRGQLEQAYGRFEARLQLPSGKGLWPAFWLLGSDCGRVGWPACGEIDVMESRGAQPWRVSSAAHGPGYSAGSALIEAFEIPGRASLAADFHVYAVEWEPDELRFSVDGTTYHTVRASRLPAGGRWVFDHPFFVILNLAVGGTFGGPPDATTAFPQTLWVDHVRVYRR